MHHYLRLALFANGHNGNIHIVSLYQFDFIVLENKNGDYLAYEMF